MVVLPPPPLITTGPELVVPPALVLLPPWPVEGGLLLEPPGPLGGLLGGTLVLPPLVGNWFSGGSVSTVGDEVGCVPASKSGSGGTTTRC